MGDVQPLRVNLTPEQRARDYVHITLTDVPDPLWHCGLVVSRTTRRGPAAAAVPPSSGELASLALLHRPELKFDTEIFGQQLAFGIDPALWLDAWAEAQGFDVMAQKRFATRAGTVGDLVVRWEADGAGFMGRLFCMKVGARMMLVWFRAAEADYPAAAEAMFLSISTFSLLNEGDGPLAEKVHWLDKVRPEPWRVAIPVSWEITDEPETDQVGSFQATLFSQADADAARSMLGKLSFAVVSPAVIGTPEAAFETMRRALVDMGVQVKAGAIQPEAVRAPYTRGWQSDSAAMVNGVAAEARCRVLRHPRAWVAGLMLGPTREASVMSWMRNRRMLDLAMMTMEIGT